MAATPAGSGHELTGERTPGTGDTPVQLPDLGAPELDEALQRCNFPLVIWDASRGVVALGNQAAADVLEIPLSELVGSRVVDLASPRAAVERTVDDIGSGILKGLRGNRELTLADRRHVGVQVWTRDIDLAGVAGAVTLVIPDTQIGLLGRDPTRPWRDLVPIAVALVDVDWRIEGISADIVGVIERPASECIGHRLSELVQPDDFLQLQGPDGHPPQSPTTRRRIRVAHRDGSWVRVRLLLSPATERGEGQTWVGMIGPSTPSAASDASDSSDARVRELEFRLRRIGAEVRAAGLLDNMTALPPPREHPEIGELTTRQWEILSLLLQGQRVSTIAQSLFVSQSTVRNHLATIFKKFGVHSQAELLEKLRTRDPEAARR
jgi:DNA-binding CsgD family transcriptional regulator/PAS domain-containing protein